MSDADEQSRDLTVDPLDDLTELGDIGAQARSEWRAEYDETVGEARMQWEHGRTLMERVRDLMSRGDQVRIDTAGATFIGVLIDLGTNWCSCATPAGSVDIQLLNAAGTPLPVVIRRITREQSGGRRSPHQPISFRAHLYELEMNGAPIRVGSYALADSATGLLTVSADHMTVDSGEQCAWLPIDVVSWLTVE
ncbi:MAG: hypothetical protein ACOYN3_02865 [Acidimicrobiia bacterium]